MEPISFAALIAAIKGAIGSIKKVVELISEGQSVWGQIKGLFLFPSKKNRKPNLSKEQIEFKETAEKILKEENQARALKNTKLDIDDRFGIGTADRITKAQEKNKRLAQDRALKKKERHDATIYWLKEFLKLMVVLFFSIAGGYIIWINRMQ